VTGPATKTRHDKPQTTNGGRRLFDEAFLQRLEKLSIVSRRMAFGLGKGERRSPRKGSGVEFRDYRPYIVGDDLRYVDWNIYSRLGRMVLKLFVEEEDLCVHLLVDSSASMAFGRPPKLDYALRTAGALGYIGLANLERVAVGLFGEGVATHLRPRRGRGQILPLLEYLGSVRPLAGRTDLKASLKEYALKATMPGVAVVISDLLDPEGYQGGLAALRRHRLEVMLLHLVAEEELHPDLVGDVRLLDAEGGPAREVTVDGPILAAYQERLHGFFAEVERFCLRHRVDYVRCSTAVPFEALILRHLRQGGFVR
jgi:uncharacterized protein (DUF58 family)